jgi:hypothetical protein
MSATVVDIRRREATADALVNIFIFVLSYSHVAYLDYDGEPF